MFFSTAGNLSLSDLLKAPWGVCGRGKEGTQVSAPGLSQFVSLCRAVPGGSQRAFTGPRCQALKELRGVVTHHLHVKSSRGLAAPLQRRGAPSSGCGW